MKVFGGTYDGRNRVIVAAPSKKKAHEAVSKALLGVSYYSWDLYTAESKNQEEVALSKSLPLRVFTKLDDYKSGVWVDITK